MENISKHLSYKEATHSNTAKARKIDNTPSPDTLVKMKYVAENVFEPLREWYDSPIYINSFYRSEELNYAIRGAKNSQHKKGEAIDISAGSSTENKKLFDWIAENLEYDQLINEYGYKWIHVSLKMSNNRMMKFDIK